jgi:hypothetical protein
LQAAAVPLVADPDADAEVSKSLTVDPKLFRRNWEPPAYVPRIRPSSAAAGTVAASKGGAGGPGKGGGRGRGHGQEQGRGHAVLWCRRRAPQPQWSAQPGTLYRHVID